MALQEHWIDKLDRGEWLRWLRVLVALLLLGGLFLTYNWRGYHNLDTQEAMDTAQLARNVADGKGFTTYFIRPFSLHLVYDQNKARAAGTEGADTDYYRIRTEMHPDISNSPLYPAVLAGWMKVYPVVLKGMDFVRRHTPLLGSRLPPLDDSQNNRLWQRNGRFAWYPPDFFITALNQVMFLAVVIVTFFVAHRLFDLRIARLSALLLLGCELLWRFSVSGLSTMFLLLLFMLLVRTLVLLEDEFREPRLSLRGVLILSLMPGLLLGMGTLTNYLFGWLIFPVLVFLISFSGRRRWVTMSVITLVVFTCLVAPWIARNWYVSGTPGGTRSFTPIETQLFIKHGLQKSLHPEFKGNYFRMTTSKLMSGMRRVVEEELPQLGGSWTMPFFFVGLMLRFRKPSISRMRLFLVWSLITMVVVQALGWTQISLDSPQINTENLLVLLTPLVLVYGVGLFFTLLDQIEFTYEKMRYVVMTVFWLIISLPLLGVLAGWKAPPRVFPPYSPEAIQRIAGWTTDNEMLMSDIPWAVAWYGKRQCIMQSPGLGDSLFALNDYVKPVRLLYLTQETTDIRLYSDWIAGSDGAWASLVATLYFRKEIPPRYPWHYIAPGMPAGQVVLSDRERWNAEAQGSQTNSVFGP